jgi:hypothetical protein
MSKLADGKGCQQLLSCSRHSFSAFRRRSKVHYRGCKCPPLALIRHCVLGPRPGAPGSHRSAGGSGNIAVSDFAARREFLPLWATACPYEIHRRPVSLERAVPLWVAHHMPSTWLSRNPNPPPPHYWSQSRTTCSECVTTTDLCVRRRWIVSSHGRFIFEERALGKRCIRGWLKVMTPCGLVTSTKCFGGTAKSSLKKKEQ